MRDIWLVILSLAWAVVALISLCVFAREPFSVYRRWSFSEHVLFWSCLVNLLSATVRALVELSK